MNALKLLSLLLSMVLLTACADQRAQLALSQPTSPHKAAGGGTRILVSFVDRSINRAPLSDATSYYRRRSSHQESYQNTSWSQRVSLELGEKYGLRYVGGWPITSLTEYCAIYEIPADRSPEEIIDLLSHDERVGTAQKVQTFKALAGEYSDPYFNLQAGLRSLQIKAAHRWATGYNVKIGGCSKASGRNRR
jgi:hypothetical protein